jgi:hypothetical protein
VTHYGHATTPAQTPSAPSTSEATVVIGPPLDAGPAVVIAPEGAAANDLQRAAATAPDQQGPSIRQGATTVDGLLPAEVIQRIVRQNFGRFRLCYENGLRSDPKLQGRISVAFTIAADGSVRKASNGGADLPDQSVIGCVVRGFTGLSFPRPERGGTVRVVYPIDFLPGN